MPSSNATLDLYVCHSMQETVEKWLLSAGYDYLQHREGRDNSSEVASLEMSGVERIFTYRNHIAMTVRVITAVSSPLEVVLRQYCITHEMAYCLYPGATLECRRSIILQSHDEGDPVGIVQSIDRTFRFSYSTSVNEAESILYPDQVRWLGDPRCWRIPLDTSALTASWQDDLLFSSWKFIYTPHPTMEFEVVTNQSLRNTYIVGDPAIHALCVAFSTIFNAIPSNHRLLRQFDRDLAGFLACWLPRQDRRSLTVIELLDVTYFIRLFSLLDLPDLE
ncbi:hypothetical protein NM688_g8851 [Phlebia brevispora]|uniref:Uncharacterized protein n=1 Tax=Phlebia brevispora TaxID=194682 RepID=A0ACC1RMP7_9APHY|nr:hypothetical protein NM688_g8851 [Phlebia brevispora]